MSTPTEDLSNLEPEPAGAPVFVDTSGRRARRIERLAALIVLVCMGYGLALLIAAVTGVPIQGAIVPYPDLGANPHVSHPAPSPTPTPGLVNGAVLTQPSPTAGKTASHTPSAHPTPSATSSATHTTGRPTPRPTTTATPTRGKSTSAPGVTHRPTAHPTSTHSPAVHP